MNNKEFTSYLKDPLPVTIGSRVVSLIHLVREGRNKYDTIPPGMEGKVESIHNSAQRAYINFGEPYGLVNCLLLKSHLRVEDERKNLPDLEFDS